MIRPRHRAAAQREGAGIGRLMLLVLCLYGVVVAIRTVPHGLDISRLVVAGDRFFDRDALTYPIAVEPRSSGYDGQFYYRLALDPFTTERVRYGITLDHPQVRAQRIVYPLLAWAASLGRGGLVPYALLAVNLASLLGLCWVGGRLARLYALPARFALLFPFYPGFVISIARDTAEALASFLSLLAFYLFATRRQRTGTVAACLAVLSRESTLFYLGGFGVDALRRYAGFRTGLRTVLLCLAPVATLCVWQLVLRQVWGIFPFERVGGDDIGRVPLHGMAEWAGIYLDRLVQRPRYPDLFCLVALAMVPAFAIVVGVRARWSRETLPALVPWLLYAALASLFTGAIWVEAYGFVRILCDLFLLGVLTLMASGREALLARLVRVVGAMWIATVVYVA